MLELFDKIQFNKLFEMDSYKIANSFAMANERLK